MNVYLLIMIAVTKITTRTMTIMRIAMITIDATTPTKVDKIIKDLNLHSWI